MVEGFVLPEGLSGPLKNEVRLPCRSAFQPSHEGLHGNLRLQEHMDVIGHDHPGSQGIEISFLLTIPAGMLHHLRHANIFQPNGSERGFVCLPVDANEGFSNRLVASGRLQTGSTLPRVRDANAGSFLR